jgi:hypothetical protein
MIYSAIIHLFSRAIYCIRQQKEVTTSSDFETTEKAVSKHTTEKAVSKHVHNVLVVFLS